MPVFNVQDYGAFPNGMDATRGFREAIAAAQSVPGGATVHAPSGVYAFSSRVAGPFSASMQVHRLGAPIVFTGDGAGSTVLQAQVPGQTLVSVHTDGTIIEGMTLDCQAYQGGSCLGVGSVGLDTSGNAIGGNHITLQDCTALGSSGNKRFTLFFAGPPGASQGHLHYQSFNVVSNCTVHDQIDDDGFSFSFQNNGTIQGITHFGSRLAIFECENLLVENYDYSPNPACNQGAAQGVVTNGFWITPPSDNIVIRAFTTSGDGGIISGLSQERIVTNVQIIDQVFTGTGGTLQIGNSQDVTIQGGMMERNTLLINPGNPGEHSPVGYPAGATGLMVVGTQVSQVRVQTAADDNHPTRRMGPPLVEATFTNCTFDGTPIVGADLQPTFWDVQVLGSPYPPGPAAFFLEGCTFTDQGGGLVLGAPSQTVQQCAVSGSVVTLELAGAQRGLIAGELVSVGGLAGFSEHAPNGVFALDSASVSGSGATATTSVTYTVRSAPVGLWSRGGRVAAQPGSLMSVTHCAVSGTSVTLELDSVDAVSANEAIVVTGLEGFGSGDPNGTYVIETVSKGTGERGSITYTAPTPPTGTWASGGTVLAQPIVLAISGMAPINVAPPVVTGPATTGQPLSASTGEWMSQLEGAPSFSYQWSTGKGPIPGATSATYIPLPQQVGDGIRVTVTATNSVGATAVTSQPAIVKSPH